MLPSYGPRPPSATELRAVHHLATADILQLGNDPMLFRVVRLERSSELPDASFHVVLRSLDELSGAMLVRAGRELVLVVPRSLR